MPLVFLFVVWVGAGCASYYNKTQDFQREFQQGDLSEALHILQKRDYLAHSKSKFIYYVDNGLLNSILGRYKESNDYFEKAYLFREDYQKNFTTIGLSYLTNPNIVEYPGEDHEHLILLYYKALNYLKLNNPDKALVECRRLNLRLQELSDRYQSPDKYRRDAFIHTLMGIIYQATKDYNNAFIAYRNALQVYEEDYSKMFGVSAPQQLKIDLLNTAYWTGLTQEYEDYKVAFGMEDYHVSRNPAELIFFWHNGLGPVKSEWSINFVIDKGLNNTFMFNNEAMNLAFPFEVENEDDRNSLTNLRVFRVAFPKYNVRLPYFESASITKDSIQFPLEIAEDVTKIAIHSLNQRMVFEFSQGLLRAALKKAAEHSMRKENEALGSLMGIVNAMTEHADTRNWQTLPHSISYCRVPLQPGANSVTFRMKSDINEENFTFSYEAHEGETLFHTFSSLETSGNYHR